MATLTYNGITLSNPNITSVTTLARYDHGDQGVPLTVTTISATGTVSVVAGGDLDNGVDTVRRALLQPRQSLTLRLGGTSNLYSVTGGDHGGGPKPRRVEVNTIVGSHFCHVVFEVDVYLSECATPGNVLSNRFSITHALDDRFYTTRTTRGVVIVKYDPSGGSTNGNPDAVRAMVVPTVPNGFRRESSSFGVSADGLTMEYEVVDQEVYRTAPPPAVRASGTFSHQTDSTGVTWFNHCRVDLEGHKASSKLDMLNAATAIVSDRINFSNELIISARVTEQLYENKISVEFVTRVFSALSAQSFAMPNPSPLFKRMLGSESNVSEALGVYGSSLMKAAKMALMGCGSSVEAGQAEPASGSPSGPVFSAGIVPGKQSVSGSASEQMSSEHKQFSYQCFEETLAQRQFNGLVALPSANVTTPAKVYQLHSPYIMTVQEGYAVRNGKAVDVPEPRHGGSSYVAYRSIQPSAPKLAADKNTFVYSANWRYEIIRVLSQSELIDRQGLTDSNPGVSTFIPRQLASNNVHTAAFLTPNHKIVFTP